MTELNPTQTLALQLQQPNNRFQAHQILFRHRHGDQSPPFHEEIVDLWHSATAKLLIMAFREGGKSTIAEEAIILAAIFKLFHNCLIICSTESRAYDRLRAIKHEFEHNEIISGLYGNLVGEVWNEGKIILANGVCIQAVGRGQKLRGVKHLAHRPDLCFADDIEDEENIREPKARAETLRWFMGVVLPALDKRARVRMLATPLDREALPLTLSARPEWQTRVYPIEHLDPQGQRIATWPSRYPIEWIDGKKSEMEGLGLHHDYQREYMCVAEDPQAKIFTDDIVRVVPKVRVWQTTYAFIDPARSVKASSATTGWAVWSYWGSKITVWDGGASLMLPSEIVDHIFNLNDQYSPAAIGVEETGLNEFLMQPLRIEMQKRKILVPVLPVQAPHGKYKFIEALQPVMHSGELSFARELPVLRAQFLSYPTGRIDGPNALAYALRMRPGEVVLPAFNINKHIVESLPLYRQLPFFLALHASATMTTGVLMQAVDGGLIVHADYIREDKPGGAVSDIVAEARLKIGDLAPSAPGLVAYAPPAHFADYDTLGLRGAARAVPIELSRGSQPQVGTDALRTLLQRDTSRGEPQLRIHFGVRWVINGFASGYAYDIGRDGALKSEPRNNSYKLFCESIGCVAGLLVSNPDRLRPDSYTKNYAFTPEGRRYQSLLPTARPEQELKRP